MAEKASIENDQDGGAPNLSIAQRLYGILERDGQGRKIHKRTEIAEYINEFYARRGIEETITDNTVKNYTHGETNAPGIFLAGIIAFIWDREGRKISAEWLLTGKGEPSLPWTDQDVIEYIHKLTGLIRRPDGTWRAGTDEEKGKC